MLPLPPLQQCIAKASSRERAQAHRAASHPISSWAARRSSSRHPKRAVTASLSSAHTAYKRCIQAARRGMQASGWGAHAHESEDPESAGTLARPRSQRHAQQQCCHTLSMRTTSHDVHRAKQQSNAITISMLSSGAPATRANPAHFLKPLCLAPWQRVQIWGKTATGRNPPQIAPANMETRAGSAPSPDPGSCCSARRFCLK